MKTPRLLAVFVALTSIARAVDTTPPTLDITHTWIEKRPYYDGKTYNWFSMYLDPQDETGLLPNTAPPNTNPPTPPPANNTIWFRSALNTSTIPANAAWNWMPWKRGERFEIGFICTSCVIEIHARDAAGNLSPVQRRYFASPFPYGPAPILTPQLNPTVAGAAPSYSGSATDCRGLFSLQFDGLGTEDLVQVDRATGNIMVRRDIYGPNPVSDVSFTLPVNTITDSAAADLDGDGRAELVIATGGVSLYHNDGPDVNGVVQFSPRVLSLTGTGIVTVQNIVLGDTTGEGKPEVIISGIDTNGDTRIGWIIKDDIWDYNAANSSAAPAGSSPGKLAAADMNGDGKLDMVMVDAAHTQMIIFKNKGLGVLAGDGEADVNFQPVLIPTGLGQAGPNPTIPYFDAPVRALTIGDVTGDGRPDIVTVMHPHIDRTGNGEQTEQRWRLYENRSDSYFRPHTDLLLGQSPVSQTVEDAFQSDVVLIEMGEDRFPELVFTNYYNNSIKVIRFTPLLGSSNELITLDDGSGAPELDEQDYVPPSSGAPLLGPARLALGTNHNRTTKPTVIPMTWATSDVSRMLYFYTPSSSKPLDIQGGRTTQSDEIGVRGANGFYEYTAFVGETIDHTLTATNNTDNALAGVFMDSTLMANESTPNGNSDAGWSSRTDSLFGKHIRYTVDIPAHSVVVKNYQTKILSGAVGGKISGTCLLRQGTANTRLASNGMPLVTLKDPVQFRATVETQSDNSGGDTAHAEEWIAYRMTMTNLSETTASAKDLLFTLPANTTHLDHSPDSVLGVTPVIKVGGTAYSPWKPNATIALNQKVIGSDNNLYQCTANGISGLTEPAWNDAIDGLTNDGPVVWKHMGTSSAAPWKANTVFAIDKVVIGSNKHLYQCIVSGTSGSNQPTWNTSLDGLTSDGPIMWRHISSNPLALTSFTWSTFDLPPDDPMTVELENEKTIEVRVKIKAGLANGTKITRGLITFTRSDNTKQTASAWITTLLNPLEVTLTRDLTIARPGEVVRYTFTVTNHQFINMGNCKVVDVIPPGMVFVESGASDGTDSGISGGTGHFTSFPGYKKNNLTPTSSPVALDALNIITWNLGTIPARVSRNIVFDLQVQHDVPDSYNYGTDHPTVDLSNFSYNFVGNNSLGKRLFAATPTLGATTGAVQGAASLFLVAPNTARHTLLSGDDPIDAPRLYSIKSFIGDGKQQVGGETQNILVNDSAVTTDAVGTFFILYSNAGAGDARNVVFRDFVPTNMSFTGFVQKLGIAVTDFSKYRFYTAANVELKFSDAFTDTNGNGFADPGEPYTDTNSNGKFDGFTASQVRWMDLHLGDLAGGSSDPLGNGGFITYRVQATATSGIITSTAGGMSGVKEGVNYTATTGYHLRADNLRFPINGSPENLKIIIVPPAVVTFPVQTIKSRSSISDTESSEIAIPYEIKGATGLTLSNLFMDLDIPKGYEVRNAIVRSTSGAIIRTNKALPPPDNTVPTGGVTVTVNAAGVTHIQFPLDGQRIAFPSFFIGVNPATKSALLTNGVTTKPLTYTPKITGKFVKAPPPPPAMALAHGYMAAADTPPTPVPLGAVSTFGTLPALVDSTKDSRIFVGRSAPISVKRGDTFQYVIYVGNLTNNQLNFGSVTMNVPEGCTALSARAYQYSGLDLNLSFEVAGTLGASGGTITPTTGSVSSDQKTMTWNTPLAAGKPVTWAISTMNPSEAGAISLTVKVLESFTGDRIDDNSVVFDVRNACAKTPGALGVVVRAGNETAHSAAVTQRAVDGLQLRVSNEVTAALRTNFALNPSSNHITFGGPDVMTMNNGVGMVPLASERVFIIGPASAVSAPLANQMLDNGRVRIAVGPGNASTGIKLVNPPTYPSGLLLLPNTLFSDMKFSASGNIVAGGGGNIVAAGGGNIVAAGGGNLQGASIGATIKMPDGSTAVLVEDLVNGGAKLVGQDGASIVAAGGGNIVAAGGGNIVAAGGGNVVSNDGAGIVAAGGGNIIGEHGAGLVGQDGASIVAGGGGNILTISSGNLIQANGVVQGLGK